MFFSDYDVAKRETYTKGTSMLREQSYVAVVNAATQTREFQSLNVRDKSRRDIGSPTTQFSQRGDSV
jgi:hypothetical protein